MQLQQVRGENVFFQKVDALLGCLHLACHVTIKHAQLAFQQELESYESHEADSQVGTPEII